MADGCLVGGGGLFGFALTLQEPSRSDLSEIVKGQTGLISLQRPLKYLPCDINEVIHRKAAARPTAPLPQPLLSHLPPVSLLGQGSSVPGKQPLQAP